MTQPLFFMLKMLDSVNKLQLVFPAITFRKIRLVNFEFLHLTEQIYCGFSVAEASKYCLLEQYSCFQNTTLKFCH